MARMKAKAKKKASAPKPKRAGKEYGDRLITVRRALGYEEAAEFAKVLEIHPGTYRNYERGRSEMSYADMKRIAEEGGSIEYLVLGIPPAVAAALQKSG